MSERRKGKDNRIDDHDFHKKLIEGTRREIQRRETLQDIAHYNDSQSERSLHIEEQIIDIPLQLTGLLEGARPWLVNYRSKAKLPYYESRLNDIFNQARTLFGLPPLPTSDQESVFEAQQSLPEEQQK